MIRRKSNDDCFLLCGLPCFIGLIQVGSIESKYSLEDDRPHLTGSSEPDQGRTARHTQSSESANETPRTEPVLAGVGLDAMCCRD
jgi:hypothetical protein